MQSSILVSAVSDLYFIYCVTSRTLNFDCIENKESRVRPSAAGSAKDAEYAK